MRRDNRGFGILAMVLVVLLLLVIIAFAQALGRSSTTRTALRVTDIRSAFEVGESAIAEAVVQLRANLDTGQVTPECADDWRALIGRAFRERSGPPAGRKIVPRKTRATFQTPSLSSTVGDVGVELVMLTLPEGQPGRPTPPPQGVLELAVTVDINRLAARVRKTMRQRRSFHVSWPAELPGAGDPTAPTAQFTVLANPLGTVVE